jgi:hypothetical protein
MNGRDCADDSGAPVKTIRIETTLVGYSELWKDVTTYGVLVLLLALGAVASLYVNYKFPDDRIRKALKGRLDALDEAAESLSRQLASRLRVMVGVERRAMRGRLKSLSWSSPDFEAIRAQIDESICRLMKRVDVLARMGRLREEYDRIKNLQVPPSVLDCLETLFEQTVRLLLVFQPSEADIATAEQNLKRVGDALDDWASPEGGPPRDPKLTEQIAARVQGLCKATQAGGPLDADDWRAFVAKFPALSALLKAGAPDPANLAPSDYYEQDRVALLGATLRDYVRIRREHAGLAESRLGQKEPELIELMQLGTASDLLRARRLVGEMAKEIYVEDVLREVSAGRAEILIDRSRVRLYEPARFTVKFHNPDFETARARESLVPLWTFVRKGDAQDELSEEGWCVAHYFAEQTSYSIRVTFRRIDAVQTPGTVEAPHAMEKVVNVGVAADRQRGTRLAGRGGGLLALALALAPVLFGLLAGAKDQLLKMGLGAALFSVFVLGFGSDQVKNLLTRQKGS